MECQAMPNEFYNLRVTTGMAITPQVQLVNDMRSNTRNTILTPFFFLLKNFIFHQNEQDKIYSGIAFQFLKIFTNIPFKNSYLNLCLSYVTHHGGVRKGFRKGISDVFYSQCMQLFSTVWITCVSGDIDPFSPQKQACLELRIITSGTRFNGASC